MAGVGGEGTAINVVAANAQFFGGGLNIAPKAMLTDGEFDVQVFTGPRRQVFSLLPRCHGECGSQKNTSMPVEMVTRKVREFGEDGIILYGYKFRPLLQEAVS